MLSSQNDDGQSNAAEMLDANMKQGADLRGLFYKERGADRSAGYGMLRRREKLVFLPNE